MKAIIDSTCDWVPKKILVTKISSGLDLTHGCSLLVLGLEGHQSSLSPLQFCYSLKFKKKKIVFISGVSKYRHSRSKLRKYTFHFGFINKLC